jgi:hypothetical protein
MLNLEISSNCWICEGWSEWEFTFKEEIDDFG